MELFVFFDILLGYIEYGWDNGICLFVVWLMYDLEYLENLFVVLLVCYGWMLCGELVVVYDCSNIQVCSFIYDDKYWGWMVVYCYMG